MAIDFNAASKRVTHNRSRAIDRSEKRKREIARRSMEIRQEVTKYFGGKFGKPEQAPHTEANEDGVLLTHNGKSIQIDVNDDGTFTVKDEQSRVYGKESGTMKENLSDDEISDAIFEFIYPGD